MFPFFNTVLISNPLLIYVYVSIGHVIHDNCWRDLSLRMAHVKHQNRVSTEIGWMHFDMSNIHRERLILSNYRSQGYYMPEILGHQHVTGLGRQRWVIRCLKLIVLTYSLKGIYQIYP